MKIQNASSLPLASLLFIVACGSAPEPESFDGLKRNGLHVNGLTSNGLHINGMSANGLHVNGMSANGLFDNGPELEGLYVDGSQISTTIASTSQVVSGAELVGATFDVTAHEAGVDVPYVLRIDHVERDAGAVTPDVYLYSISYRHPGDETWRSACTDDSGAPEPAIPMQGFRWDPTTGQRSAAPGVVTLACKSGAIGSCASWGYRPWVSALLDHHQACIYMKRADYCGDGTPHTMNGTWIDIYDRLSPQLQAQATGWPLEAHWGSQGASCIGTRRHPEIRFSGRCMRDGQLVALPACGEAAGASDLLSDRAHPGHGR